MPREFYPDTDVKEERPDEANCRAEIELFDGPGICMRKKDHPIDDERWIYPGNDGEFHQEHLEGWVWNSKGVG